MKTIEMYRQNISICSVAAYKQTKEGKHNGDLSGIIDP